MCSISQYLNDDTAKCFNIHVVVFVSGLHCIRRVTFYWIATEEDNHTVVETFGIIIQVLVVNSIGRCRTVPK